VPLRGRNPSQNFLILDDMSQFDLSLLGCGRTIGEAEEGTKTHDCGYRLSQSGTINRVSIATTRASRRVPDLRRRKRRPFACIGLANNELRFSGVVDTRIYRALSLNHRKIQPNNFNFRQDATSAIFGDAPGEHCD
jgi:hypothetical protein